MTIDNLAMEVEKTVYRGVPFNYKAKRDRYYDLSASATISENATIEVNLQPYAGLDATCVFYQNNAPLITMGSGQLPDYTQYAGTSGCLAGAGRYYLVDEDGVASIHSGLLDAETATNIPVATEAAVAYNVFFNGTETVISSAAAKTGYRWIGTATVPAHEATQWVRPHFEINGGVTITNNVASFNGGVLAAVCPFPEISFFPMKFDFTTKVVAKAGAETRYQTLWNATEKGCSIGLYGSLWAIAVNNTINSQGSIEDNTTYWVRVAEGDNYYTSLYYMVDDGTYTLDTLPEVSDSAWQIGGSCAMSSTQRLFDGQAFTFSSADAVKSWIGTVDLANTVIRAQSSEHDADGGSGLWTVFWRPLETLTA